MSSGVQVVIDRRYNPSPYVADMLYRQLYRDWFMFPYFVWPRNNIISMPQGHAIREFNARYVAPGVRRVFTDWIRTEPYWYEWQGAWYSLWEKWEILEGVPHYTFRLTDPSWWWEVDVVDWLPVTDEEKVWLIYLPHQYGAGAP